MVSRAADALLSLAHSVPLLRPCAAVLRGLYKVYSVRRVAAVTVACTNSVPHPFKLRLLFVGAHQEVRVHKQLVSEFITRIATLSDLQRQFIDFRSTSGGAAAPSSGPPQGPIPAGTQALVATAALDIDVEPFHKILLDSKKAIEVRMGWRVTQLSTPFPTPD